SASRPISPTLLKAPAVPTRDISSEPAGISALVPAAPSAYQGNSLNLIAGVWADGISLISSHLRCARRRACREALAERRAGARHLLGENPGAEVGMRKSCGGLAL